jgi:DNA-binding LytR/AlgR family response regulator
MNCIVVDDSKIARETIKSLIAQFNFLTLVQECENPMDAFNYIKNKPVDLVFLDVEMPEMSGIDLIKNLNKRPIIVLVTSQKNYAVEAFALNVTDYLVKPIDRSRFMIAISKAKEVFENSKVTGNLKDIEYIFVRSNNILLKIKITDIKYIQAMGDYVNIFTAEKRHLVHITLKDIEERLPPDKFYRLHRSYLVALDHIDNIEESSAYTGKHPVPISEQFKKGLLKKLNLI